MVVYPRPSSDDPARFKGTLVGYRSLGPEPDYPAISSAYTTTDRTYASRAHRETIWIPPARRLVSIELYRRLGCPNDRISASSTGLFDGLRSTMTEPRRFSALFDSSASCFSCDAREFGFTRGEMGFPSPSRLIVQLLPSTFDRDDWSTIGFGF